GGRLPVAADLVRAVRRFHALDLVLGERHVDRAERVFEMLDLGGAEDRGGQPRPRQQPGERDLGRPDALPGGDLDHRVRDREVLVGVQRVAELVVVRAYGPLLAARATVAGEQTAGERAPRDEPDTLVDAER